MKAKSKFGSRLKKRKRTTHKQSQGAYLEPYRRGCGIKKKKDRGEEKTVVEVIDIVNASKTSTNRPQYFKICE